MSALIYQYYEEGVEINGKTSYACKLCKALGVNKSYFSETTSNLISHLQSNVHKAEYKIYLEKKNELDKGDTPSRAAKKLLFESPINNKREVIDTCFITNNISSSSKYTVNSIKQRERLIHACTHFLLN